MKFDKVMIIIIIIIILLLLLLLRRRNRRNNNTNLKIKMFTCRMSIALQILGDLTD